MRLARLTHTQVFKDTVEGMFRLIGREDPKAEAEMVYSLEHSIAEIQVGRSAQGRRAEAAPKPRRSRLDRAL
jgi:hypothetical protein